MKLQFGLAHGRFQYLTFHSELLGRIFATNTVFVQCFFNTLASCGVLFSNGAVHMPELVYFVGGFLLNTEEM